MLAWVQATQPAAWAALTKNHGAAAQATLLDRLRKSLDDRGTLDVLRHGVELLGLRQPVALAQFKPALAMNPDTLARYGANRLRVVRQLRYSFLPFDPGDDGAAGNPPNPDGHRTTYLWRQVWEFARATPRCHTFRRARLRCPHHVRTRR